MKKANDIPLVIKNPINLLRVYLPHIYKLISDSKKMISRVEKSYSSRLRSVIDSIEQSGVFSARTTVFDLMWEALEKNQESIIFLRFIDSTVRQLLSAINQQLKRQVAKLCYKMIVTFNQYDSQYKNHFAEIAVINKILTDTRFRLLQIEKEMANGKSFDFSISNKGEENLVEVYNIDFNIERLKTKEGFHLFIETRLTKKLNEKLVGLPVPYPPNITIPVLWGEIVRLEPFEPVLDAFTPHGIVGPFMMFAQYKAVDGLIKYDFSTVKAFLEIVKKIRAGNNRSKN